MRWQRYLFLPLLLCCSACALFQPRGDHFSARPVTYESLKDWQADNHADALKVFLASCPLMAKRPGGTTTGSGFEISQSLWKSLCDDAKNTLPDDEGAARLFFERRFVPYRILNNGSEKGLFTGYYEPVLYGSRTKKGDYIYPVYTPPPELKKNTPYFTHAQIDNGALAKRKLELAWVDDPVMLFFLQIQGSGRIHYSDGTEMLIGYAGQNGYAYESLGKIMGDEGRIPKDQINFFTIRQWLYNHPDQAFALMERNPSYVFFKRLTTTGPVGAAGAVLTPQRSLAVDNKYIPYGMPLFIETDLPAMPQATPVPFHRIVIAQDTGGAIRGPVRGDVFFGTGGDAEYLAGYMKGRGVYSLLVPKEAASQLQ